MENNEANESFGNVAKLRYGIALVFCSFAGGIYAISELHTAIPLIIGMVVMVGYGAIAFSKGYDTVEYTECMPECTTPPQSPKERLYEVNKKLDHAIAAKHVCKKCGKYLATWETVEYTTSQGKSYRLHPSCKAWLLSEAKKRGMSAERVLHGYSAV